MQNSNEQVCDDLLSLLNRTKAAAAALAEAHGITHMQLFALYSIDKRGELAMGQVAGVLRCDASNVTGIVDRMVGQGLIVREECATDRRTKTLHLTDKGRQLITELRKSLPVKLGCDSLDAGERESLHTIIAKLCS